MTPTSPPPGWYHAQGDPPGTHRWWDGARWVGGPNIAQGWSGAPAPGSAGPYGYALGQRHGVPLLAGFWPRLGAMIIDGLILGVPGSLLSGVVLGFAPTEQRPCYESFSGRQQLCEVPTTESVVSIILLSVVLGVAGVIFYYGQLEGKTGQTVGKRALGIKTVRRSNGDVPGVNRAIGRAFARYISILPCYLGFLWMLWDRDQQTWHDKMCDTIVIKA